MRQNTAPPRRAQVVWSSYRTDRGRHAPTTTGARLVAVAAALLLLVANEEVSSFVASSSKEPYKKYVYFGKKDKNDIFIRNNHFVEYMFVPWLSETLEYGNNYADKVGFKKLKLQMNKIGIGMKQCVRASGTAVPF